MPVHTDMVVTPTTTKLLKNSVHYFAHLPEETKGLYVQLSSGRHPKALIFNCADAVCSPFPYHTGVPGDIMAFANAGPSILHSARAKDSVDAAAAIIDVAMGKQSLETIGVIGHQDCAYCAGFLSPMLSLEQQPCSGEQKNLQAWVRHHGPVTRELMLHNYGPPPDPSDTDRWNEYLWLAVLEHTKQQYYHLLSYEHVLRRVDEGSLTVFAAVLQLTPEPDLLWFDPMTVHFKSGSSAVRGTTAEIELATAK